MTRTFLIPVALVGTLCLLFGGLAMRPASSGAMRPASSGTSSAPDWFGQGAFEKVTGTDATILRVSDTEIIERITGRTALNRLRDVQAEPHKRAAFQRASARLRALGYKPTNTVVVYRQYRPDSLKSGKRGAVRPIQESVSDGSGELIFWSWDDGYSGTWEGQLYGERYADGAWHLASNQADISTEEFYAIWSTDEGHSDGGGTPPIGFRNGARPGLQLISDAPLDARRLQRVQDDARSRFNAWLNCARNFCAASTMRCMMMGPQFPNCMIIACGGSMVGCYASIYWPR